MAQPGIGTTVKTGRLDGSMWILEWTYGASGAVTLDATKSDQDERVTTPVADGGTGITNIKFPKCRRATVLHCSLEPATADIADPTDYRLAQPIAVNAAAGTCAVYLVQVEATEALADPETGARGRLVLLLEAV